MTELVIGYSGRVQGVGFRATVLDVSRDFQVAGWVANVADGSVRLVAEAAGEAELLAFRDAIVLRLSRNIVTAQESWRSKPKADFAGFSIASDLIH